MIDMIPVFEQLRDRDLFGPAVVVHLGNNGPITQATLDAFLATMDRRAERHPGDGAGRPQLDG